MDHYGLYDASNMASFPVRPVSLTACLTGKFTFAPQHVIKPWIARGARSWKRHHRFVFNINRILLLHIRHDMPASLAFDIGVLGIKILHNIATIFSHPNQRL